MNGVSFKWIKRRLREGALTRHLYRFAHGMYYYNARLWDRLRYGRSFPPEFFDAAFSRRADYWGFEDCEGHTLRKDIFLTMVKERQVSSLLEIGCAFGWMTKDLAKIADSVTAVDISMRAIAMCKERCSAANNIDFTHLDIYTENPSGTFDMVVCAGVLEYIPWEAQEAVRERIVTAIKSKGYLILENPCKASVAEVAGKRIHDYYLDHPKLILVERIEMEYNEILLYKKC